MKTGGVLPLALAVLTLVMTFTAACATTTVGPQVSQPTQNGNGTDAAPRPQAEVHSVSGHWEGTTIVSGQWTRQITMVLQQVGEQVEGTHHFHAISYPSRPYRVVGTLRNGRLSLTFPGATNGAHIEAEVIGGDYIRGTLINFEGTSHFNARKSP